MSQLTALALVAGVLGGIATAVSLHVPGLLIWAIFIGLACFFHSGGDNNALKNTIVGNVFGCVVATITAVVILSLPGLAETLTLPIWAGIAVGVAVVVVVLAANVPTFALIPATVYGFASTFAFLLQTPDALSIASLTSLNFSGNAPLISDNALISVAVSLVIGAVLGYVTGKITAMIAKPAPA